MHKAETDIPDGFVRAIIPNESIRIVELLKQVNHRLKQQYVQNQNQQQQQLQQNQPSYQQQQYVSVFISIYINDMRII